MSKKLPKEMLPVVPLIGLFLNYNPGECGWIVASPAPLAECVQAHRKRLINLGFT